MLALYTCTVLAVLNLGTGVTERTVSVLVPHLVRGLRTTRCHGYQAGSYMILGQLCTVAKLKEEFLDTLLPLLVKVSEMEFRFVSLYRRIKFAFSEERFCDLLFVMNYYI